MNGMEVPKELKSDIEANQYQLKAAICNHQNTLAKLELDPHNEELRAEVNRAEEEIISIGLAQKVLLERLKEEYNAYQKSLKTNLIKQQQGLEERRFNLTNALNRARKQNIVVRSTSATSSSDDSNEILSAHSSPEAQAHPVEPHDISQNAFLHYFGLGTHELYKEMQNKRAERKRRSTANPQFLYGNKGWDFLTSNKRKRNTFLISPISPPHTRQSVKKRQERNSPPLAAAAQKGEQNANRAVFSTFPTIPNLPSGLIIERVSPGSSSPDSKICVVCKQPGALSICEVCTNGFHISCHNRPLTHTPRQCPKCLIKETRTVGSLTVPSGMSVSYVTSNEVSEKINQKKELEEKKQNLTAELTQLQNRHSQLTISLRNQKSEQDELRMTQQNTEEKIKEILTFIERIQMQNDDNSES